MIKSLFSKADRHQRNLFLKTLCTRSESYLFSSSQEHLTSTATEPEVSKNVMKKEGSEGN